MIFERLPKITKIEGGASPLASAEFVLDNYRAVAFIITNAQDNELTIKVKANTEDGTAEYIPFLLKENTDIDFEKVDTEGKMLTAGGVFIAAVTADSLGRKELDRVSVEVISDANVETIFALQTQPRYHE